MLFVKNFRDQSFGLAKVSTKLPNYLTFWLADWT